MEYISDEVSLFGYDFAATTFPEAIETILALSASPRATYVVTANVDHIVELVSLRPTPRRSPTSGRYGPTCR